MEIVHESTAAAAESLQSCPTLCDPKDGSPPGSPVPGILQARTLEWVAISFSNAWKWKVKGKSLSHVWLLATPLTAAYQAPPSMGFSRQEYWSGVPLPSPGGSLRICNSSGFHSVIARIWTKLFLFNVILNFLIKQLNYSSNQVLVRSILWNQQRYHCFDWRVDEVGDGNLWGWEPACSALW